MPWSDSKMISQRVRLVGTGVGVRVNRISVVIATKDRPVELMKCLASIEAQGCRPCEVIIVDSSSTDKVQSTAEMLGCQFPVRYIYAEANLSRARNIGIDHSIGDILTFLDDDVVLAPGCLAEIRRLFDDDLEERIGGVTAERIFESGRGLRHFVTWKILLPCYQGFARVFLLLRYGDGKLQISGHPTIIRSGTLEQPVEVEYVVGANMSFRRKVVREFRFDEHLPYFDDADFPLRVSRKWRILYAPHARFAHNVAPGGQDRGLRRWRKDLDGYKRYFAKNFPQTPGYRFIYHWVALGLFIRAVLLIMMRPFVRGYASL